MSKAKQPLDMTEDRISLAADPAVAMAAYEGDETKMLRLILSLMCLDSHCRDLFESVCAEGYSGVSAYSSYGSDYDDTQEWMETLRKRIEFESDVLRNHLDEREKMQSLMMEITK